MRATNGAVREHGQSLTSSLTKLPSVGFGPRALPVFQAAHDFVDKKRAVEESISVAPRRKVSHRDWVIGLWCDEDPVVIRVQLDGTRVRQ